MIGQLNRSLYVCLTVALAVPVSAAAQVSLVRNGQADAVIVTASTPSPTARYAVEELVRHIELATGVRLPVVAEPDEPEDLHTRVYVGDTQTARRNGIDPDALPRESWVLRSVGNDLFIVGREDDGDPLAENNPHVGTLFGVYRFLEDAVGVRWLWPGDLGTYAPRTRTLQVPSLNQMDAPSLRFRHFYWGRTQSLLRDNAPYDEGDARLGFTPEVARSYAEAVRVLLRRHRLGGLDAKPPVGHTASGWWGKYGEEHPEWFAMRRDGTRGSPNKDDVNVELCVSNEELQDFIVSQWDGESVLLLGPVDRPGRCACSECRAWDGPQPENPPWFAQAVYRTDRRAQEHFAGATSDRYARFWKITQEKARKRNPNVVVSVSFLYENEFPAPVTGIRLNKNIYGEFVQWQDPYLRWFPMPDEAFDWIKEQWLGWRKTGIRMAYRPNYLHDGYVMPHFETRQSGEFFKFAYENGMEGASFDSLTGQWAAQGLRLYMHLRLMARPELELDDIRAEYLSAFGPAAEAMDRYFTFWEDFATANTLPFVDLYRDVGWRYSSYVRKAHEAFPPECFGPAEAILQEALDAAATSPLPEFRERVEFVRSGLEHARLAVRLTAVFDGQPDVPEGRENEAKRALEELVKFRKDHERTFFSDLLHTTAFWERPKLNLDPLLGLPARDEASAP
jgi:hypothetical protein